MRMVSPGDEIIAGLEVGSGTRRGWLWAHPPAPAAMSALAGRAPFVPEAGAVVPV